MNKFIDNKQIYFGINSGYSNNSPLFDVQVKNINQKITAKVHYRSSKLFLLNPKIDLPYNLQELSSLFSQVNHGYILNINDKNEVVCENSILLSVTIM